MTFGKASALTLGFVGAVALGVWIGPYFTEHMSIAAPSSSVAMTETEKTTATVAARARANAVPSIAISAPALHSRLKPLLNTGTNMTMAADGFRSAEQFASVAHAARNLDVPFMVLKHRVLTEGKSLTTAIRMSKPDVNASIEAERARAEARSDLAALAG